jgi:RimJ/RimL family protein N-acetyltransferase
MEQDARVVQRLARSFKVADMIHWVFLPRSEKRALGWISTTADNFARRSSVEFGIQLIRGGRMVGLVGLDHLIAEDSVAELWYMIVPSCWGRGYATEAGRAALQFGFEHLGLNRIFSYHLARNLASGRVLAKLGMTREGLLRQHVRKYEGFEDVVVLSLLREEWDKLPQNSGKAEDRGWRDADFPNPEP